jgi:hypothetical protein
MVHLPSQIQIPDPGTERPSPCPRPEESRLHIPNPAPHKNLTAAQLTDARTLKTGQGGHGPRRSHQDPCPPLLLHGRLDPVHAHRPRRHCPAGSLAVFCDALRRLKGTFPRTKIPNSHQPRQTGMHKFGATRPRKPVTLSTAEQGSIIPASTRACLFFQPHNPPPANFAILYRPRRPAFDRVQK